MITYRSSPEDERYFHDHAERLVGSMVVVYDPKEERYERAVLQGVGKPGTDSFRVSWEGRHRRLKGLWRVHHPGLFGPGQYPKKRKPIPRNAQVNGVDSASQVNNGTSRRTKSMATATKKGGAKASQSKGRGRPSPLDSLTDKQRVALANRVRKLREQGVPWDGDEGICAQVEGVSSAPIGRKLLIEAGAGDMIRERNVTSNGGSKTKTAAKAKTSAKGKAAPKAKAGAKKVVVRRGKGSKNPS